MYRLRDLHPPQCTGAMVDKPLVKESYRVNLPLQMAECEANYLRITKLLSTKLLSTKPLTNKPLSSNSLSANSLPTSSFSGASQDEHHFMVSRGSVSWLHKLQVIERSRYTTTLLLTQESSSASSWLKMPRLTVRVYHDARLAEVLAWEGHKRLRPRYEYPNSLMYQADEKLQLNRFLGEWLNLCLAQGHSLDDLDCLQTS